jgi:hypothetical protein
MTPQFYTMTSLRTLIILLAFPSVHGYATSAPRTKPALLPKTVPTKRQSVPSSRPPQNYDLGLGKNAPLNTSQTQVPVQDVQMASKFWSSNEPAVSFPSPLSRGEEESESIVQPQQKLSKKPKRKSVPLYHKRQSQDVLEISGDCMTPRSAMVSSAKKQQLDVNTVWVEMLIHNQQQMQLAHCSQ